MPDWYLLDQAATRYGVGPWEFLERPAVYLQWASTAISAENEAAEAKRKQQEGAAN